MKQRKPVILTILPYLIAFLIPVLVMLIVFLERGIYPFGDKCFLRTDLYHQYAPFMKELKTKFSEGGSLFYSWNVGGGTNFWALTAYYLASPFNILLFLVPENSVIEFITALIVIKEGLSSVTMTYYLNKREGKTGFSAYPAVFFGVFYGLSGFMCAYQWNIMWLDSLWLFPLVILGLERIVKGEKGLLYGFTLGLTILTNYYMAIMVCFGIACYCFFLLGTEPKMREHFGRKLLVFLFYTVLAFLFSAVLFLPYLKYFGMTASASSTFKYEWYSYFTVFEMIARHLIDVDVHIGLEHWPNIYCGVIVFLLLPLYYLNRKVTLREKIGYTILLLFFYFSFSTRTMDYLWHGLHIPNSLPARQSFIYIFIVLAMCYKGFSGLKERTYRDLTITMVLALAFVFAVEFIEKDSGMFHMHTFYVSALLILLYVILGYIYKRGKAYTDVLLVAFLSLAAIETCINTSVTSVPTVTRSEYMDYDAGMAALQTELTEREGDGFYRVEKVSNRTKNDGAWLDYRSVSTFSSVANANLTEFYKTLGLEASTNAYGSKGQTPFTNMLLSVKYSIARDSQPDSSLYSLVDTQSEVYLYENRYTLPLGFLIPSGDLQSYMPGANGIESQNALAKAVSGVSDLFTDVTTDSFASSTVTQFISESGFYYAVSASGGPKQIRASYGSTVKTFDNLNRGYTMTLGYLSGGGSLTFDNAEENSVKTLSIRVYRLNEDLLPKVYEAFSKIPMQVTDYTDTTVSAVIHATKSGMLVTTIPYEDGWQVYVDGEECKPEKVLDAYIGLHLTPGSHEITFRYHVPGFTLGLILTILASMIYLLILLFPLYRQKLQLLRNRLTGKQPEVQPAEFPEPSSEEE